MGTRNVDEVLRELAAAEAALLKASAALSSAKQAKEDAFRRAQDLRFEFEGIYLDMADAVRENAKALFADAESQTHRVEVLEDIREVPLYGPGDIVSSAGTGPQEITFADLPLPMQAATEPA